MEKSAVLAPMPTAMVRMATSEKPGLLRSPRGDSQIGHRSTGAEQRMCHAQFAIPTANSLNPRL
jgi:hypothetical protein